MRGAAIGWLAVAVAFACGGRHEGGAPATSGGSEQPPGSATNVPAATATLTVGFSGDGEVTAAGRSCAPSCVLAVTAGTRVVVAAKAAATSRFTGWSDADCGGPTCEITVDSDRQVMAKFERPPAPPPPAGARRLTIEIAPGNGTGRLVGGRYVHPAGEPGPKPGVEFGCDSTCTLDFADGAEVMIWAETNAAVEWGGDCTPGVDLCYLILDGDRWAAAAFVGSRLQPAWTTANLASGAYDVVDGEGNIYWSPCSISGRANPTTDCRLLSLDAQGATRFSVELGSGSLATTAAAVTLAAAGFVFTTFDGTIAGRRPTDGSVVFQRDLTDRFPVDAPSRILAPAASDGTRVHVAAGTHLVVLDAATGAVVRDTDAGAAIGALILDESANAYLGTSTCGVTSDTCHAWITSLDAGGAVRFRREAALSSMPLAVAAGALLTTGGDLYDAATGELRAHLAPAIASGTHAPLTAPVITPAGTVIFSGSQDVEAFDSRGTQLWTAPQLRGALVWPQLTADGTVLFTDASSVREVDMAGHTVRQDWITAADPMGALVSDGLFLAAAAPGAVLAYRLPAAPRLAQRGWVGFRGGPDAQNRAR